ncbi:uncharacterized protein MONOS_6633 [Monocercomonoides exilis]|uniref:uncharacterized protein n=1 Tax=Monocercomonoides exilis TaxID=2049356 RepID=UPI00355A2F83|nr:hypothetical protein MONOS_6633 [Monocercomonoides exilis]|eukprot:MONOS_6633.1-p1 / transcript=MONOS_6633.1 / gene=MONOS_6633 / organism=Monocercomonoides_exilis_PA203 / gene_product=unspecified product / transcript_product=unspecified product / location=Mono_scaffold00212:35432-35799(-) / protein_length=100 / sequence_SO=supercontig / SO=protein_coding / is_pseudo=false
MNHAFANELSPADETFNRFDGLIFKEHDVLKIAYQTLSLTDAHAVFEIGRGAESTAMHFLEQVPICEVDAPLQSIVLQNEGGMSINFRLDLTEVERLNA